MSSILNEENATALNSELAKRNIDEFKYACREAGTCLIDAYCFLFDELYYIWASPKAVEFNGTFKTKIKNMIGSFEVAARIATQNAIRQYNMTARANGTSQIKDDTLGPLDNNDYQPDYNLYIEGICHDLVDNQSGVTGMNIDQIKNLLSLFGTKIANAEAVIDEIPSYIALFDTNNAQQQDFVMNVKNVKAKVEELNVEISKAITEAIETEINQLRLATNQNNNSMNA